MLPNHEGQRVPDVTFRTREGDRWRDVTSDEIFKGKAVVVFALPGAFTPTCSSTHLPRYEELAGALRQNGVDDIVCISVNDAFVMNEWARNQACKSVRVLPDGNGDFTEGMGMLVDKRNLGFGKRSWRYSMLVRDGVVEKMFVEPEKEGDPFEVSDADTMLHYLNPDAKPPEVVALFTRPGCPHCARAKKALDERGWRYEEIVLGRDASAKTLRAVTGQGTVPQVYIGGRHIGGADDLERYLASQKGAPVAA